MYGIISPAITHSIAVFPVNESFLTLCLQDIADSALSKSAVKQAFNTISWVHQMASVPSPKESTFVKLTVQGLQRKLAVPVVKTLPVTVTMLEAIVDIAECLGAQTDLCLARVSVIGYATSLRFNKLVHISRLRILQVKRASCQFRSPRVRLISSKRVTK